MKKNISFVLAILVIATLLTAALQWIDRTSKRSTDHVITKYTAID